MTYLQAMRDINRLEIELCRRRHKGLFNPKRKRMKIHIETTRHEYTVRGDQITTNEGFLVIIKSEQVIHMVQKETVYRVFLEHEDVSQVQSETSDSGQPEVPVKA